MPETEIITVDVQQPEQSAIARAADLLRAGQLVAFPTETVYGLGADALQPQAVARIFEVKGRPAANPVIVHVADAAQACELVQSWPDAAVLLAERFWPGPLTIVLPRRPIVPDAVTAGGPTVALRCPRHPVALALLTALGRPIAAPSANPSTRVSPTQAGHVLAGLGGKIPLILDAGPCTAGIESTVIDLTDQPVRVLRPGPIGLCELRGLLGEVAEGPAPGPIRSPGLMHQHYRPRAPLLLVPTAADAESLLARYPQARVLWDLANIGSPHDYAQKLYAALHLYDQQFDMLIVILPPDREEWRAVRDRLLRAGTIARTQLDPN